MLNFVPSFHTGAAELELRQPQISAGVEEGFCEIIPVRISLMLLVQIRAALQQLKSDQKPQPQRQRRRSLCAPDQSD